MTAPSYPGNELSRRMPSARSSARLSSSLRCQHTDVADVARAGDDANHPVASPQRLRGLTERRADHLKQIAQQVLLPFGPVPAK